jgi:hypothetical protein
MFLVCRSSEDDCITTPRKGLRLIGINSIESQLDTTGSRCNAGNGADQLVIAVRPVRMKQPYTVKRLHYREVLFPIQNSGPKDLRLEPGRTINIANQDVDSQATGNALTIGHGIRSVAVLLWNTHSSPANMA